MEKKLPVFRPFIESEEKEKVLEALDFGWISSDGPIVEEFEEKFSSYLGVSEGVSVCNGTAALETAFYAIGLKPGDEIIMPSFTIISCAIAALRVGAKPVLVDILPDHWGMNVDQISKKITSSTKAILAVHMYGQPLDMDPILEIAKKNNLYVVEDAAQVHGANYKGKKVGSLGDVGCFSFYANKAITTGEGGMVVTSKPLFAARARSYRNLCFKPEQRFFHEELGYNFRLGSLQAALGIAQLKKIEITNARKIRLAQIYRKHLGSISGIRLPVEKGWADSVYWMICVQLKMGRLGYAQEVMQALRIRGIDTRPFFLGLHEQPALQQKGLFIGESYPVTEEASQNGFYLPSSLDLTEEDVIRVTQALKDILV